MSGHVRVLAAAGLSAVLLLPGTGAVAHSTAADGSAAHRGAGSTAKVVTPRAARSPHSADPTFGPAQHAAAIATARATATRVRSALGLPRSERLVVTDVVRDRDGATHVRYDRRYRGLPVIGGDLIVHRSPAGAIRSVDWNSHADLTKLGAVEPGVSSARALRSASRVTGLGTLAGTPRLAVWALHGTPRLAWHVSVENARGKGHARDTAYVDATSGSVLGHWSEIQSAGIDAPGTGNSLYSGTVTVEADDTSGTGTGPYELRDLTRGGHYVTDMNGQDLGKGALFTDADNTWGNGTTSSRQSAAVDAQYGAAETWDFYKAEFNRHGIRNDGKGSYSRVHFDDDNSPGNTGPGYDNAFWDDGCFCMTYGDGQTEFKPLVSLDVAGHEMSHGVTSNTAGLLYFGESGGLNEATSDIFGTGVEFAANNAKDPGDYYIGENITQVSPGFLRRMDNPAKDAPLYGFKFHSFNCWQPKIGRADVHLSSGVANHFFYLLAEGSGAKTIGGLPHNSPTCNGATVTGIGRDAAEKIWYRALTVYLTSGSSFRDARDATVRAALALDPTGAECKAVTQAGGAVAGKQQLWSCAGNTSSGRGNLLRNGGFEAGATRWSTASSIRAGVITRKQGYYAGPRSGSWYAVVNGKGKPSTQAITQRVTLPRARKLTLVYHLLIDSYETTSRRVDTLRVQVSTRKGRWTTLARFDNTAWDDAYNRHTLALSTYRGKTVAIRFLGVDTARKGKPNRPTAFEIDDVSLTKG